MFFNLTAYRHQQQGLLKYQASSSYRLLYIGWCQRQQGKHQTTQWFYFFLVYSTEIDACNEMRKSYLYEAAFDDSGFSTSRKIFFFIYFQVFILDFSTIQLLVFSNSFITNVLFTFFCSPIKMISNNKACQTLEGFITKYLHAFC